MIACAALEAIAKNYCVSLCYCASVYAVACALPVVTILHNAVEERQSLVKQVNLLFVINQLLDFCYCLFIIFPALCITYFITAISCSVLWLTMTLSFSEINGHYGFTGCIVIFWTLIFIHFHLVFK